MARYKYHIIVNKDYKEGTIKAFNYSDARKKVCYKFRHGKIQSLDVKECESYIKTIIVGFLMGLMQVLIKIIPVAIAILLIYLALRFLI